MCSIAHLYKISVQYELKETDNPRGITFCKWLLQFVRYIMSKLITSFYLDEAWFHLNGYTPYIHCILGGGVQKIHANSEQLCCIS